MNNSKLQVINQGTGTVILVRVCPFCGKEVRKEVDAREFYDGMYAYENGAMLQNAFPSFTPEVREMIKTGICQSCWDNL